MLEGYTTNQAVSATAAIPINVVTLDKGTSATFSGTSAIELNKCGIYEVHVDAVVAATAAGTLSIQMLKNGVAVPQALTAETATSTELHALSFTTLVQVPHNNTNCCCSSPTTLSFINGIAATYTQFNVCVNKVC